MSVEAELLGVPRKQLFLSLGFALGMLRRDVLDALAVVGATRDRLYWGMRLLTERGGLLESLKGGLLSLCYPVEGG
jgi:hypothetical protein